MRRRSWLEAIAVGLGSLAIASCGGGSDDEARDLAARSILDDPPPLKEALVGRDEIEKQGLQSPERAFLQLWRSLQYQSWLDAVLSYTPALRRAVGDDRLVEALKGQAAYFRSVRPSLRETIRRGRRATLEYIITDLSGDRTPRSVSLVETGRGWEVFYDPFLDEALREAARAATQAEINPLARKPDKRALAAGAAASQLQSAYLAQALRLRLNGLGEAP